MHRSSIIAAACSAALALGAAAPAHADDGVVPAPDPAAVTDTAAAIATQAADAADPGQYQPDTGQYQAPSPANINVSVRVLSPGDDGAVDQSVSIAQPSEGSAAPAPSVTISVNVNITQNWNIVFSPPATSGQYHAPDNQYQDPVAVGAAISAAASPPAPVEAPPADSPPPPARDHWGGRPPAEREAAPVARPHRSRGTRHRPAAAPAQERPAPSAAPAAAASPPPPPGPVVVTHAAPPRSNAGTRPRPARPPAPRHERAPDQYAGAAAAGGITLVNVLQTLGLLLALLAVSAVGPARRLAEESRRLRGVVEPRQPKPG